MAVTDGRGRVSHRLGRGDEAGSQAFTSVCCSSLAAVDTLVGCSGWNPLILQQVMDQGCSGQKASCKGANLYRTHLCSRKRLL